VFAAADVCRTIPPGYADTACYVLAGGKGYCPELVARPVWYQDLSDRTLIDQRIDTIMKDSSATGTACCLRPLTGRNKGTSQVVCASGRAVPAPRVKPPTDVAVPGETLQGWPRECTGAAGLSLKKIQKMLGQGGVGPVALGKGAYVQRTRDCSQISGCKPWALIWSPRNSNLDWQTHQPVLMTQPDLVLEVISNEANLYLRAPYTGTGATDVCKSNKLVYTPGSPDVGGGFAASLGYMDAARGFGCRPNGFTTQINGNSVPTFVKGKITDSCASFFSDVLTYTTASGYSETQWAFYTEF
jgi:hypothetical protein